MSKCEKIYFEKYVIYFGHGWLHDTNLQGSIHKTWTFKCWNVNELSLLHVCE